MFLTHVQGCGKGSASERTRSGVTAALHTSLKDATLSFQQLRQRMQDEYRSVFGSRTTRHVSLSSMILSLLPSSCSCRDGATRVAARYTPCRSFCSHGTACRIGADFLMAHMQMHCIAVVPGLPLRPHPTCSQASLAHQQPLQLKRLHRFVSVVEYGVGLHGNTYTCRGLHSFRSETEMSATFPIHQACNSVMT